MSGRGPKRRGLGGEMTHATATVIAGEPVALHYDATIGTGDVRGLVARILVQQAINLGRGASLAEVDFELSAKCIHVFVYGLYRLPMSSEGRADRGWQASPT